LNFAQDALYLMDFGASLRLLSLKEDVGEEASKLLNKFANEVDEAEAGLHQSFFTVGNFAAHQC
jgi:hypothetical protein